IPGDAAGICAIRRRRARHVLPDRLSAAPLRAARGPLARPRPPSGARRRVLPQLPEARVSRADRASRGRRARAADRGLARLHLRVSLHGLRGAGHAPAHSGDEPGHPGMASLSIISWRDIPAQVVVRRGRETAKVQLSPRFQEAVDRAAMRAGRGSSNAYLAAWKRSEARPCGDDIQAEAAAEAARIEASFSDEQLEELIRAKGLAAGSGPGPAAGSGPAPAAGSG